MKLLSVCEGKDVGDTILLIAGQIHYGKEYIMTNKELATSVMELNMKAGKMAMGSCDHKAAYSYLQTALALLPEECWESNNLRQTLQLHFLMANVANSCGKYDEAKLMLEKIFEKAVCIEDKLPSYLLMSTSKCCA